MARWTARSLKQVRMQMVGMDGQHSPSSLALSASEMKTAFCVGGILIGQHAAMTRVLML
jgi:hypothetical protein